MKKRITALLTLILALCFLLSACSGKTKKDTSSSSKAESSAAADDAQNEEGWETGNDTVLSVDGGTDLQFDPDGHNKNYSVANGYVSGISYKEILSTQSSVVICDGVAYVADDSGVRMIRQDGSTRYVTHTNALSVATNGETVLFTTDLYEMASYSGENASGEYPKGEIRSVNRDGSDEKTLVSCTAYASPVMMYENKLYYADASTEQYAVRRMYAVDPETGEPEEVAKGCRFPRTIGTKMVYANYGTDFSIFGQLSTYDYTSGKTEDLEDQIGIMVDCADDMIYFDYARPMAENGSDLGCIASCDIQSGEITPLLSSKDNQLYLSCVADGKIFYAERKGYDLVYFTADVTGNNVTQTDYNSFVKTTNCVIATKDGARCGYIDGDFVVLPLPDDEEIVEYYGDLCFTREYESDTNTINVYRIGE